MTLWLIIKRVGRGFIFIEVLYYSASFTYPSLTSTHCVIPPSFVCFVRQTFPLSLLEHFLLPYTVTSIYSLKLDFAICSGWSMNAEIGASLFRNFLCVSVMTIFSNHPFVVDFATLRFWDALLFYILSVTRLPQAPVHHVSLLSLNSKLGSSLVRESH